MQLELHFVAFGLLISLVDIATHRIHRASLMIATLTLVPFLTLKISLISGIVLFIALRTRTMLFAKIGMGDRLLLPLVTIYLLLEYRFSLLSVVTFAILTLISLKRTSKVAAAPSIFLLTSIISEIQ